MQTTDDACRELKLLDNGGIPNTHLQEITHNNVTLIVKTGFCILYLYTKLVFVFQTTFLYKY